MTTDRQPFLDRLGFSADTYQLDSFDVMDDGKHLIVAAPTGAGKTVVGSYAVWRAIRAGRRVFYTTPIKALSNQKFNDMVAEYGRDQVGLVTGDNVINPDAPVVIMTTEVLRNMLYSDNDLSELASVVLDEVHYLQDPYRGAVWEEVIIHLPERIQLVCLSATVSNSEELRRWIETVRGPTALVIETKRPVELTNLYLVGERGNNHLNLIRTLRNGKANPKGFRFDNDPRANRRKGKSKYQKGRPKARYRTPSRSDTVQLLNKRDLLPAIFFIFSRQACDDAVRQILDSGQSFTTSTEMDQIDLMIDLVVSTLDPADLDVLGFDRIRYALKHGIASHHAGMIPPLKELVERLFTRGLVRVVFATETLALGINMPARTVVIEKLTKWNGESHQFLTPSQFTQLTGRAGRRGIDEKGQAVVLWSSWARFEQVASLAKSKEFSLTSSFKPTYNMAANLILNFTPEESKNLLAKSFAQFKANAALVVGQTKLEKLSQKRNKLASHIESDFGPVDDLRRLAADGEANAKIRKQLRRLDRADADMALMEVSLTAESESIVRHFERISELLTERGHIDGWRLTSSGEMLTKVYNENDLFLVEAVEAGIFDGLDAAELAAVVSMCVYESRGRDDSGAPWYPNQAVRQRAGALYQLHQDLSKCERQHLLEETKAPDAGFVGIAHGWAAGVDLGDIMEASEITAGDFVRTIKILSDVLRQIANLAPNLATAHAARSASDAVHRGLIAAESSVESDEEPEADPEPMAP